MITYIDLMEASIKCETSIQKLHRISNTRQLLDDEINALNYLIETRRFFLEEAKEVYWELHRSLAKVFIHQN